MPYHIVVCKHCEKEFETRFQRKYCSRKCYLDNTKEKRKRQNRIFFGKNKQRARNLEDTYAGIDSRLESEYGKETF